MMLVNVKSALYGMQEVLPHFKSRGQGQIINISSMLGRVPMVPVRSAYSASKHFLNALTANFRSEVQETHKGIQITLVSPGVVATDFGNNAVYGGVDSRNIPGAQSAEDVAAAIAAAIESRSADVYTRPDGREMVVKYFSDAVGTGLFSTAWARGGRRSSTGPPSPNCPKLWKKAPSLREARQRDADFARRAGGRAPLHEDGRLISAFRDGAAAGPAGVRHQQIHRAPHAQEA